MVTIEVSAVMPGIDFGATKMAEIIQNVQTIITTPIGSVPLDRGLGLDLSSLDAPTAFTQAELTPLIIEAIQTYEPRVIVESVSYRATAQGKLTPLVAIELAEGVTL